jgi:hypothetical protein
MQVKFSLRTIPVALALVLILFAVAPAQPETVNADGDIEAPVLKSIVDKIRQESGVSAEIPMDRLVDLSILRQVRAEPKIR